jgi:hypothetical protein
MKKITLLLIIINLILVSVSFYLTNRGPTVSSPLYTYKNSTKLINYYFDYRNFKIVYNSKVNNIEMENGQGDKLNLFATNGNADWYIKNILTKWSQLPEDKDHIQLLPPKECAYLLITTKTTTTNAHLLYDILDTWDDCPNI